MGRTGETVKRAETVTHKRNRREDGNVRKEGMKERETVCGVWFVVQSREELSKRDQAKALSVARSKGTSNFRRTFAGGEVLQK